MNTRPTENLILDSFWNFIDARFSDPQAKAKALYRLQSIKQRSNEDVRDYLARFESELLESEVLMDNAVKISTFTRGLRIQLQRDVAIVNNSTDFETSVMKLSAFKTPIAVSTFSAKEKPPFISVTPRLRSPTPWLWIRSLLVPIEPV